MRCISCSDNQHVSTTTSRVQWRPKNSHVPAGTASSSLATLAPSLASNMGKYLLFNSLNLFSMICKKSGFLARLMIEVGSRNED